MTLTTMTLALAGCTGSTTDSSDGAAPQHTPGMNHTEGMEHDSTTAAPDAPGQSAFGAIQEIIAVLEADPETDWGQVDIDGLREHLVDMDRLTLHADVSTDTLPDGAAFHVTGDARTIEALHRMVLTHTNMALQSIPGWTATATTSSDGLTLTVTSAEAGEAAHIQGLGFFGVMATGAEHPVHHLMMARGMMH